MKSRKQKSTKRYKQGSAATNIGKQLSASIKKEGKKHLSELGTAAKTHLKKHLSDALNKINKNIEDGTYEHHVKNALKEVMAERAKKYEQGKTRPKAYKKKRLHKSKH